MVDTLDAGGGVHKHPDEGYQFGFEKGPFGGTVEGLTELLGVMSCLVDNGCHCRCRDSVLSCNVCMVVLGNDNSVKHFKSLLRVETASGIALSSTGW